MFHPSRCITHPFLTDEAIRRRNTNTREMGLATICRPPHTTERDKLEEILKQKERGVLHCILWESDSPLTLYANMLLDTNCIGWCNGQNHKARYCVLLKPTKCHLGIHLLFIFSRFCSSGNHFLKVPVCFSSTLALQLPQVLQHLSVYTPKCERWNKNRRKIIKDAKYEGKQH